MDTHGSPYLPPVRADGTEPLNCPTGAKLCQGRRHNRARTCLLLCEPKVRAPSRSGPTPHELSMQVTFAIDSATTCFSIQTIHFAPRFESRPSHRLSWLRCWCVSSIPPNRLQFIIHVSPCYTTQRRMVRSWISMASGRNCRSLIQVLSRHLLGSPKDPRKRFIRTGRCPVRDSNGAHHIYE
jgi:hypothetical protein